jgi:8-oxo-dGTP diphosphatase
VNFCSRCGAALAGPPPTTCTSCGYELYVNARPTGSVIVVDRVDRVDGVDGVEGERFLALRRAREPKSGQWEIPGGFCDGWEHPADAAVREACEELGVPVTLGDLVGLYLGSYEFQGETLPVLDAIWLARIVSGTITLDPHESHEYAWLSLVDPPQLAFDSMNAALRDAATRLRSTGFIGSAQGNYTVDR